MRYVAGHSLRIPNTPRNRVEVDHTNHVAHIELIGSPPSGMFATIDLGDLDHVLQVRWRLNNRSAPKHYAIGTVFGGKTQSLHRFIMGLQRGDPREVDHIDGNGLNNTRSNLRICTHEENSRNTRKLSRPCFSKYRGVCRDKRDGRWQANITKNGKQHNLGRFDTEEDAAKAYDTAARMMFGAFARLNFPDE